MKEVKALEKSGDNDSDSNQASPWSGFSFKPIRMARHGEFDRKLAQNLGDLGNVVIIAQTTGFGLNWL